MRCVCAHVCACACRNQWKCTDGIHARGWAHLAKPSEIEDVTDTARSLRDPKAASTKPTRLVGVCSLLKRRTCPSCEQGVCRHGCVARGECGLRMRNSLSATASWCGARRVSRVSRVRPNGRRVRGPRQRGSLLARWLKGHAHCFTRPSLQHTSKSRPSLQVEATGFPAASTDTQAPMSTRDSAIAFCLKLLRLGWAGAAVSCGEGCAYISTDLLALLLWHWQNNRKYAAGALGRCC